MWVDKQRPSNHRCAQEGCQGKDNLALSVKLCGEKSLSPAVFLEQAHPAQLLFERAYQNLNI
ncbi:hypothetical protein Krac_9598 [Ktedonobacter racemifer DSM 44963]|uniref:Uncharacterized protein n=1 Tax=Ktedonobacter racemifer DSM 44963 TaxID=485913 RepID=D6TCS5_KTERA|nr:hypothetical protein Krac_9598 [Ktedonobacter racemifer DSM 44963]